MVFEETIKEENIKLLKPNAKTKVRIDLEPEREFNLQQIKKAYSKKVKKISRTKLLKMAVDNLIKNVEDLPEEEGLEYLRTLYKEAEF